MNNENIDDKLDALLRHEPDYMDGSDFCDDVQIAIERRMRVRRMIILTPTIIVSLFLLFTSVVPSLGTYLTYVINEIGNLEAEQFGFGIVLLGVTIWFVLESD